MATRPWIILIQSRLPYRANRLSGKLLTHFVSIFPSYTRSRPYTAQKIKGFLHFAEELLECV